MHSLNRRLLETLTAPKLWAILPEHFSSLLASLLRADADVQERKNFTALKAKAIGTRNAKLMVIPVQGILTKDDSYLGTTYGSIADAAEQAASDPAVKRIVLAVDSPGGEITGLPETARVLSQVRQVKPVYSMVEGMAASAAYWLASQSTSLHIAPSGEVGSVGVRMMHMDISKMLDDAGVKVTELYSGDFKTEWSPYQPLSKEAIGDMQKRLTTAHNDFIKDLAQGRGIAPNRPTDAIANARYGEGRMFSATDAYGHGLADKILSPREFYRSITPTEEEPSSPVYGLTRTARARVDLERMKAR